MKKTYISPELDIFYDVLEPFLTRASEDIESVDNNPDNGGSTLGNVNGVNYGDDWTQGGNLNDGDLE